MRRMTELPANDPFLEKPAVGWAPLMSWLFWGTIAWAFASVVGVTAYQALHALVGML